MGFDITELIMGIEDALQVPITNDVAASLTTPRRLINYLRGKLPHSPWSPCLSQRAFYELRRPLAARCDLPITALRPATELALFAARPDYRAG
jgi:hypothetical protein